jgi:tetratricopeptide (TPR) repeat protein
MRRSCAVYRIVGLAIVLCVARAASGAEDPTRLAAMHQAYLLWQQGHALHLLGQYEEAVQHFSRSIELYPTAEAYTFRGWSLSMSNRYAEAIADCKQAIELDPDYGNPYNDIGVYLIELGRPQEAIPWLEKAIQAKRYCCYQFPHFNLGRILVMLGKLEEAKRSFERALSHESDYEPARRALEIIRPHLRETI